MTAKVSFLTHKLLCNKQLFNPKIPAFGCTQSQDLGLRKPAGIPDCNPYSDPNVKHQWL